MADNAQRNMLLIMALRIAVSVVLWRDSLSLAAQSSSHMLLRLAFAAEAAVSDQMTPLHRSLRRSFSCTLWYRFGSLNQSVSS